VAELKPRALVRSTSDDVEGPDIEAEVTAAAAALGVPIFVIEDFPGNFRDSEGISLVFVEDETVAALHAARGVEPARIQATGNPRYDALRTIDAPTRRADVRRALGIGDEGVALWVGQPDAETSFVSLETVLPSLARAQTTVLFRAHPRDTAYASGRYARLLGTVGTRVIDTTSAKDVVGLCCAADLVVTQFSSVAVEAGYLGTPALFVLLPELGGGYMRMRKGYAIPPWCKENCAFLLEDAKMAADVVGRALYDPVAREAVRTNFARRYASRPPSAPAIAHLITNSLEG
jgi:hypothetical protein